MDVQPTHTLDAPPTPDDVSDYRTEAADTGESVVVAYALDDGTERYLTVSPRGTCVVQEGNTTNDAFNPDVSAEEVAAACA